MRRTFASWLQDRFCLIVQVDTVRVEGSRFFDRDYDPSKSLLHVLAQRLSRTCDHDCLSPSLMHPVVGEVDLVSHVHVPAVIVWSHARLEDALWLRETCGGRLVSEVFRYWERWLRRRFLEIRWVMSLRSPRRDVLPLGLIGLQNRWSSAVVQKPATHRVS